MTLAALLAITAAFVTFVTSQQFAYVPISCDRPNQMEPVKGLPHPSGWGEKGDAGHPGKRGAIGPKGDKGAKGEIPQQIDLQEIWNVVTAANENIRELTERTQQLEAENADLKGFKAKVNSITADLNALTKIMDRIPAVVKCGAGLKDGSIPDSDITASSSYNSNHGPENARLDNRVEGNVIGAWVPSGGAHTNGWIQVDFGSPTNLTGVVTQGRPHASPDVRQWVTSFQIKYGNDEATWTTINKTFEGNRDQSSHVTNMFPAPIRARYVRLYTLQCSSHCALRMEYLTC